MLQAAQWPSAKSPLTEKKEEEEEEEEERHLQDVLLVLHMVDLLETDHVVEGEDLEGEEV